MRELIFLGKRMRCPRRGAWRPGQVVLFALVLLAVLVGGYAYYRYEADRLYEENGRDLSAIAELKVSQICQWRHERLADAERIMRGPFMRNAVRDWLKHPTDAALRDDLAERLNSEHFGDIYTDVLLLDVKGRVLLSVLPKPPPLGNETKRSLAEVVAGKKPKLSELYRCECGRVHLDAIAPILDPDETECEAVLVFRSDADKVLFPLMQSWPTPSTTAETLLVRRDGKEVLFLNELRHRQNTALTLRFPLDFENLPAVQAVLGRTGRFFEHDYRGMEVLADLRPVPDSAWFMVTKIDADEILVEVRYRAWITVVMVLLFLLLFLAGMATFHRQQEAVLFKNLYQAERKQRELQEEFRAALYSIGDAVITTDTSGRVKQMNPVAEQLTGWAESEAAGRPLEEAFRIVNETTRMPVEAPIHQVLREGKVVGLANHTLLLGKDGAEYPIADSAAPVRGHGGVTTGVILVFRDQTSERRAQTLLRESKARLDLALQSAGMGAWHWEIPTDVRVFDDQVCRLLGIEPGTYSGSADDFFKVVHPEDRPKVQAALERTLETDALYEPEYRAVWPDGTIRHITARGRIERDESGQPIRLIGLIWDITERKNIETQLRREQEFAHALLEHAGEGIVACDGNGVLALFNQTSREWHGMDALAIPPGEWAEHYDLYQFDGETPLPTEEIPLLRAYRGEVFRDAGMAIVAKGQPPRFIRSSGGPFHDKDGKLLGAVATMHDVTDNKSMVETLESALGEKTVLLKEVHHRVKNNLQIVCSLLNLQAVRTKVPEAVEALTDTGNRVRSMALLHEALYQSENIAKVHFGNYVENVCRHLLRSHGARALGVHVEQQIADIALDLDHAVSCGLIINELVTNALKHAFPDGRAGRIVVSLEPSGEGRVKLAVADDGIGLPAAFDPQKAETLGHQLIRMLVDKLDGSLEIQRHAGTQFRIDFPTKRD